MSLICSARRRLGCCFRVSDAPRVLFMRILSLFSLSNFWDDRDGGDRSQQPQQLTTILLVNQGKVTFPCYDIVRQRKIFRDRDDLIRLVSQLYLACAMMN